MLEPENVRRYERQVAAMIAAIDDPEALAEVSRILDEARPRLASKVAALRQADGYSWAELARALGVTRSAVAQRFGRAL